MPNRLSRRILMIALLLSMGAAVLAYWYLSEKVQPRPIEAGPVQNVVVGVQDIPADTRLTREMLAVREVPDHYVQPTAVSAVEDAVGKVSTVALLKGEQILTGRLAGEDSENRLAYRIPEGHRAITIPVNEVTGIGGYATVGDRVDVLLTHGENPATKTLLQNIAILATGDVTITRQDGEQHIVPSLTLSVTPEQAQIVTLAGGTGSIRLTLRSPVDEETVSLPPTKDL